MKYRFKILIPDIVVDTDNYPEAEKAAKDRLEHLGGSNTGAEMLYNADLQLITKDGEEI